MTSASPPEVPHLWGVLNVTPDSFSDGGQWLDVDAAIARGLHMWEQGAAVIDVGGESTRPGSHRIAADTEAQRVEPVVRGLAATGVKVSIDTTRASVARAALAAGAAIVNDVSGGQLDADMFGVVAAAGCDMVLMHWRAQSDVMDHHAVYEDVTADVVAELRSRVAAATAAGVLAERLIVDPGFGFAKNAQHNVTLLAELEQFVQAFSAGGVRTLIGTSRKRFLGAILKSGPTPPPPVDRDTATAATSVMAAASGAWAVRVHAIAPSRDALAVWAAVESHRLGMREGGA